MKRMLPHAEQATSGTAKAVRLAGIVLLLLPTAAGRAAHQPTTSLTTDSELVQQLLKRVEELESEVKRLKTLQAEAGPVPASTEPASKVPAAAPPPSAPPKTALEPSAARPVPPPSAQAETAAQVAPEEERPKIFDNAPNMRIRGFGDFGFHVTDRRGDSNSFSLNQFDLFLTSHLSDRLTVFSDVIFDAFSTNGFEVDVERLVLQYSPSDHLNVAFGRFLTGIGFYNFNYQHANWFQTTIGRPFIFEFDDHGGVLPAHTVGVTASGLIPSGRLGLHYLAEVGNGRTSRSRLAEPVQNFVDENNRKAINLGFFIQPDWVPGLQAGLSVYHDRLTPENLPKIGETITAVHVVYLKPSFEFLNEAIFIRHAPIGGTAIFTTPAFYSQVSRRFFGKYRPYFRYEYTNVPDSDPVNAAVRRRNGLTAGVRVDLNDYAALKLQYDHQAGRGLNPSNKLSMHLAYTF